MRLELTSIDMLVMGIIFLIPSVYICYRLAVICKKFVIDNGISKYTPKQQIVFKMLFAKLFLSGVGIVAVFIFFLVHRDLPHGLLMIIILYLGAMATSDIGLHLKLWEQQHHSSSAIKPPEG